MNDLIRRTNISRQAMTSLRIVAATMTVCSFLYGLVILCFGQTVRPEGAAGSLVRGEQGEIIGSRLIAQGFTRPEYFWPRPSAVDYHAAAAGGSNLSPTNGEIRSRAEAILAKMGVANGHPLPADLVTASGSGLDPHISLAAAEYQTERVATARGLSIPVVKALLEKSAERPGGAHAPDAIVNVLRVNMALDRLGPMR